MLSDVAGHQFLLSAEPWIYLYRIEYFFERQLAF